MTTPTAKQTQTPTRWTADPAHSSVGFQVRHMMVSTVRGTFNEVHATLDYDPENPAASKIEVRIPVDSIDTREPKRDGHLKSADFFDAEHHPEAVFVSKAIEATGDDTYRVTGDLTLRETTEEITVEVEASPVVKNPMSGTPTRGFEARATLDRKRWGLNWNAALETGGVLVGDKVKVTVDLELTPEG